jgi:DNA-binding MarR family transcriptional regulator
VFVTDTAVAAAVSSGPEPPRQRVADRDAGREQVAAVADSVVELLRTFGRARARVLAAAAHDVEWSAQLVLKCLKSAGPLRSGAVADLLQSDPSTVSRQVATLVRDGLLERRADPLDGRASLLVVTPKADAVLADHDRVRLDHFATMLDGWTDTELTEFARLLARLTAAYESADTTWIEERMASRAVRTRSNN